MLPQRLDILIAFKSIGLAPELSVTERRVAGALIDHFNRKTTQCDPSYDTLAILLSVDRRTIIRSVNRLVRLRYFRRTRHGGNFHRNFYEPLWPRFREVEVEWQSRRRKHSQRFCEGKLSPWQGQPVHLAGGAASTQTSPTNISKETLASRAVRDDSKGQKASSSSQKPTTKEQSSSIRHYRPMFHVKDTRSADAANAAAERRWNTALQNRYMSTPKIYGEIISAIDPAMQAAATEAELKRHGAGLAYILDKLKRLLNGLR
jgi:flagellar hook-associated protein FlgK